MGKTTQSSQFDAFCSAIIVYGVVLGVGVGAGAALLRTFLLSFPILPISRPGLVKS